MGSRLARLLLLAAATALAVAACSVTFTDDVRYRCTTNEDCAGDGFSCAGGLCCKPDGVEVCDGRDNDCDGRTDNTGKNEICNGVDDDCNGETDENTDLRSDQNNCGACGVVCASNEVCRGRCLVPAEGNCRDGVDDNGNGKTDCLDPSCDGQSCGAACVCTSLKKAENLCSDHLDNDGDAIVDCLDPDCLGKACSQGCACIADGGVDEVDCSDQRDNDGDGKADCLDPDCAGRFCTVPDLYWTCTTAQTCRCNGGSHGPAEVGSVLCRDGVDNDCNGVRDCGETTCDTQPCSPDGGYACLCANKQKKEADCVNLADDDGDSATDCADTDCALGVTCTKPGGGAGACSASRTCE